MAFLCTFAGLLISLVIWVGLYTLTSMFHNPTLLAVAPYLEALSTTGQCLFLVLAALIALLTYRLLRPKKGNRPLDERQG